MNEIIVFLSISIVILVIITVVGWYQAVNNLNEWSTCQQDYKEYLLSELEASGKSYEAYGHYEGEKEVIDNVQEFESNVKVVTAGSAENISVYTGKKGYWHLFQKPKEAKKKNG